MIEVRGLRRSFRTRRRREVTTIEAVGRWLGAAQMGYGGFGTSYRPGSSRYGRCVGKPRPFAEIILLDPQTGVEVPGGDEAADAGAGMLDRLGEHRSAAG